MTVSPVHIVTKAKRLGCALMADSAMPFTWRLPDLELPHGCQIEAALCLGGGGLDPHGFHNLAGFQSLLERRCGGETGVRSVQVLNGEAVWAAFAAGVPGFSYELLEAALSCCDDLRGPNTVLDARPQNLSPRVSDMLARLTAAPAASGDSSIDHRQSSAAQPGPAAFIIERNDGTPTIYIHMNGGTGGSLFAAKLAVPTTQIVATQLFATPGPNVHYSACLMSNVEQMFATNEAPYPVERTLLSAAICEKGLASLAAGGRRIATPELSVCYEVGLESGHARA